VVFALLLLRGQLPVHETKCFKVGKTDIFEPISESTAMAVRGLAFNLGTVRMCARTSESGSAIRKIFNSIWCLCSSDSSI